MFLQGPVRETRFVPVPKPPSDATGRLVYGYAVEPPMVERVLREGGIWERKTNFQEKVYVFWGACFAEVRPTSEPTGLHMELRRDIDDYNKETLRGYVIAIAREWTKVVHKKELVRFEGVSADGRRTPVVEGALGCCNLSCVPFLIIVRYLLREHLWNYCEVAITA